MPNKVLTAPKAIIKVKGIDGQKTAVGKIQNIRASESIRRGKVTGLGEMTPSEVPALEWNGTFSCGQYAIKLDTGILRSLARNSDSVASFVRQTLFSDGVDVDILQKVKQEDGTITEQTFMSIQDCYIDSENFNISEGQIGGRDASFTYTKPVLYS